MEIIVTIAQTSGLIIVIMTAISGLYSYYRKAKRENEQRYIEDIKHFNRMASECEASIDEVCDTCETLQSKDLNEINDYTKMEWETTNYYKDIVIEALRGIFPELKFCSNYDIYNEIYKIDIMEATTARDEHGVFLAKTIQSFEFENYSFLDPYDTIGKVTEWCENYLRSKQEPVVNVTEKVIRPHHCECCGAPMPKGTTKCEYCGTEYY